MKVAFIDEDGVKFSADKKVLIEAPAELKSYCMPEETEEIAGEAFARCKKLYHVFFGHSLRKIGEKAFLRLPNLQEVTIHEGVVEIGDSAFAFCPHLLGITLPEGLKLIPYALLCGCEHLMEVNIPDSIETIDSMAFDGCVRLQSINIPKNLKHFTPDCFDENACSIIGENEYFKNIDGAIYSEDMHTLIYSYSNPKTFHVPDGVKEIGVEAFSRCKQIEEIVIPESVNVIHSNAFSDCLALKSVNLPQKLEKLNTNIFFNCPSLEKIVIPDNVTEIASGAFYGCTNLNGIVLPASVKEIEGNPFAGANYPIVSQNKRYVVKDVALYDTLTNTLVDVFSKADRFSVAEGTEEIGQDSIGGCPMLEIIIPTSVKALHFGALDDCETLERIVFKGKIIYAKYEFGFYNSNLREVVVPKDLVPYYKRLFGNDAELVVRDINNCPIR